MKPLPSPRRSNELWLGWPALFCVVFIAVGCFATYFMLWRPWSRWIAARSWQETPCTVVSSQVARISGSDGYTYMVDITYAWTAGGQEYRGSRYHFMAGYSTGYASKAAIVARYPAGTRTTCWVDPANPSEAVFNRDFFPIYLIGLFAPLFVAVGALGMVWVFQTAWESRSAQKALQDQGGTCEVGSEVGRAQTSIGRDQ